MRPTIHRAGTAAAPTLSRLALMLAAGFSTLSAAPLALAQQASPEAVKADDAKKDEGTDKLDVVTVSATRRREPVRDVPMRVETLGAENLTRLGASSLSDTIGSLPGVDVKTDGGPGRGTITMRGVSVGEQQIATVGVYVDDVAFGSSSAFVYGGTTALDLSLLDLNHIEVLRGPQGTLYGAGAMGGLLKYVTNEPDTTEFSGKVGLGLRSTDGGVVGHTENVVLNVPLSQDVAALRVSAFNDHDGGFIKSVGLASGDHINDGNTRGARVSVLLEPTSRMKVRLAATTQEIERNGTNIMQYDTTTGQPIYGDLTRHLNVGEPYKTKTRLVSGDIEYDFGFARLNAILASQRFDSGTGQDATELLGASAAAFDFASLNNTIRLRKQTQELRLTSSRGTVEWIIGYFHDSEAGNVGQRLWGQLAGDTGDMDLTTTGQPSHYRENAFYGDLTWNIDPSWALTVGARVARNTQDYTVYINEALSSQGTSGDKSNTYLATLRYALDKTSNVYFRAASGYRPGGPNSPAINPDGSVIPDTPKTFGHDTLWSYEVGYKADLLDRRLNIDTALYQIRWNDIQLPVAVGASTLVGNAGTARINGLELAAHYAVDQHWKLDGNLAWTQPKLTEDAPNLAANGSRLTNTAKLSYTLGLRYAFDVAGHPSYAGLNLRHVGQRNAGYDLPGTSLPNFNEPAYTLADASWGLDLGAWQISAFLRNITNKRAILAADTALTAFGLPLNVTPATPRTIGTTVSYNF